jgi:hypothetical protein
MKKQILIILISLLLLSCKKDKQQEPFLYVKVSGLSAKTSITIIILDQNNRRVLEVINKFENTSYTGIPVYSKDVLRMYINSNVASDLEGNGNGNVFLSVPKFSGSYGGNLLYPQGKVYTVSIP